MSTLYQIINWMQGALLLGFAVRIAICCIKLAHDEDEKVQIKKRIKNTIVAAVIVTVITSIRTLVEFYFKT